MTKEFIKFYVETAKNKHPFNSTDWELIEGGFIKKSDINFLGTSDRYDDCYFTRIANIDETLYVKKTDFDEVEETQPQDDEVFHKVKLKLAEDTGLKDYDPDPRYKYSEDTLELFRVCDEMAESKGVPPEPQTAHPKIMTCGKTYVWVNVDTLKDCINLLSTDGKGTKQQVKQKLEELLK